MRLFDVEDRVAPPPTPVVCVNGQEISNAAIAQEIQHHPAENPDDARKAATHALVVRELLRQEAQERGLVPDPLEFDAGQRETDEDALVRQLLDEALNLPSPNEEECQRFYETHRAQFQSPTIWEPGHILLSVAPDSPDRKIVRDKACEIIAMLLDNPNQFEQMARDYSSCPSREHGGNLGQITTGQTTLAFEEALAKLTPGSMTLQPVETKYGFHVIRLERCIEGQELPFEAVSEAVSQKISDYLADAVFQRAVSQFVTLLAGKATIEGMEIDQASSPLVQ